VTGLAQPVEISHHLRGNRRAATQTKAWSCPGSPDTFTIIGVVVSRNYPDLETLPDYLRDLEARCKEATGTGVIWVCASTDLEAKRLLAPYDHVQLPLLPYWKGETYDLRRTWRDSELVRLCDRVYVFQPATAKTTWNDWANMPLVHPGVRLVTAKSVPKTVRKRQSDGRNPRLRRTASAVRD